jgi:hypothetical protein
MKRLLTAQSKGRKDLPENCSEGFDWENLKWIWNYPKTNRPLIKEAIEKYGAEVLYLKISSTKELKLLLKVFQ